MIKKELLKEFKIRVYGIVEKDGQILLSEEIYKNAQFYKFPGGGMELGETTIDCLKREFLEELEINITQAKLLYATDILVQNQFNVSQQVMGLYFKVLVDETAISVINANLNKSFEFGQLTHFRRIWLPKDQVLQKLSFEMDQVAFKHF